MLNTDTTSKELLTAEEMAVILGVPKTWIYSRTKLGQKGIPHVRVGKYVRFQKERVLEFLAKESSL